MFLITTLIHTASLNVEVFPTETDLFLFWMTEFLFLKNDLSYKAALV